MVSAMSGDGQAAAIDPTPKRLLALSVPAVAVGVLAALVLWLLDEISLGLEWVLWDAAPGLVGVDGDSGWWIFITLTVVGLLVGLVLWLVPGHGGPDSATVELDAPVQPMKYVPGIALASILTLGGGVSLGPESPIIGIITAMTVWGLTKLWPQFPVRLSVVLALAGTIGALFGTPIAAALVLTGPIAAAPGRGSLWDRLFLPVAAASAGAVTTHMLGGGIHAIPGIEPYGSPQPFDILWGMVIATVAAGLGLVTAWALPPLHRLLRRLMRHPFLVPAVGGVLLGALGAIGGPVTLFKGLDQSAELIEGVDSYTAGQLAIILGVKMAALVVAAAASFRGGRIFPAIFLGIATGMLFHALVPDIPVGLALSAGVLGFTLAISRDGWIGIFAAIAIVGDITLIPLVCVAVLPAWLLVSRGPEMIVHPEHDETGPDEKAPKDQSPSA